MGSDDVSVASWQLDAFDTWRTLSDSESGQIEKAYCDPNNDTVATSIVVCMVHLITSANYFRPIVIQVEQASELKFMQTHSFLI